jgi:acyl-CoA oxidase
MVTVRALMAEITGWDLVKGAVTAYHYTTFRKQFRKSERQQDETTVFDYSSVKYRLLPLLAQATALVLVGRNIKKAYDDFSQLEDFHLQTVGAKVYSTEITARGIETSRIACGGHGYSALSGFGRMYANAVNAVTYEGDNYVIGKQVPRAILKHFQNKTESSLPTLSYLSILREGGSNSNSSLPVHTIEDWFKASIQKAALEQRLGNLVQQHIEDTAARKDTSYSSHSLTMAHCDFVYFNGITDVVRQLEEAGAAFASTIKATAQVFALSIIQDPHHSSLAQALSLPLEQQKLLRQAYDRAIEDFAREHVARLVEAYGLTEWELDSALARADQTPYEALLEGAKKSEMSGAGMSHLWPVMIETRGIWKQLEEEKRFGLSSKL